MGLGGLMVRGDFSNSKDRVVDLGMTESMKKAFEAAALAEAEVVLARGGRAAQSDVNAFWQRHGL
jgi:hypothetical protein